jgi:hypothetical protein
VKRTALKRKSKSETRKVQDELWQLCRKITDILYPPINGETHCYTCGKPISGSNKQLGHFLANSVCGAFLRYDLRNLRWQCYYCNINLGGNSAIFYHKLREEKGQEHIDEIMKDKQKIIKASDYFIELVNKYKGILE